MGRKSLILFGALLLVILADAGLSYRALNRLLANESKVKHTHQVLLALEATLSVLQDAETGQRGYLLTGNESYLEPYQAAASVAGERLKRVRDLSADNPSQQQFARLLEQRVAAKLDELNETIELRRRGGVAAALQVVETNRGKLLMDEIRRIVEAMRNGEDELLRGRDAESQASGQQARLTLLLISALAAVMLCIFYHRVTEDAAARSILLANEQAAHAEAAAAFVAEQQARAAAEEANRLKDEFLATVSHELRTPLTAILGWARMLGSNKFDAAATTQALQVIERNAQSQAQLIEDLLDVSRIISGKLRLEVRPIELSPVIEEALAVVRPAADAKQIRLLSSLDPEAGFVSGDPERLKQVIWNLLSNAIKFTPKGGRVQVRLERINSHVELVISDTGQGISAEFLPHVFERFWQADGTATRVQSGLGLGLAIARHLVESHGGTIEAESLGAGQGTTFIVKLPVLALRRAVESSPSHHDAERVHPTANPARAPLRNLPALDGLRVLTVDDQPDTLELINALLAQCGAESRTATRVADALVLLEEWRPDLIISDIGMPDEDGYALIGKLRALTPERGGLTPAIALTAYARVEDRMRVLSAGYQMHVPKPIEPAELAVIIASLTRRTGSV